MADPFLNMLYEANSTVTGDYPGARFYEADLNATLLGSPWRFVFNDPNTVPNSTVILYNYNGQFKLPPQHIDSPWGGDRMIPLPIPMGLEEAETLAKEAGYTGDITVVTLRWPLTPGANEPLYIFGIPSQDVHVFVGVYSRKVTTAPIDIEASVEETTA